MAVKIKLKRMGKIRSPHYRIIVADSRTKRDGRAIEEIGLYTPKSEPSFIKVDSERVQYWLGVGAQPTEPVQAILKVTGDWQKFKGLPGAEGTLKVAEPKADKRAVFDAALAEVHGEPKAEAATTKKKTAKKSSKPKDDKSKDKTEDKTEAKDAAAETEQQPEATDADAGAEQKAKDADAGAEQEAGAEPAEAETKEAKKKAKSTKPTAEEASGDEVATADASAEDGASDSAAAESASE